MRSLRQNRLSGESDSQFVGTRRFSSSNQCCTTIRLSGVGGSPVVAALLEHQESPIRGDVEHGRTFDKEIRTFEQPLRRPPVGGRRAAHGHGHDGLPLTMRGFSAKPKCLHAWRKAMVSASAATVSGRTLIATARFRFVSVARYTSPMPPTPVRCLLEFRRFRETATVRIG